MWSGVGENKYIFIKKWKKLKKKKNNNNAQTYSVNCSFDLIQNKLYIMELVGFACRQHE